jgi:hypothetical protein
VVNRFSQVVASFICAAVLLLSACATPLKPHQQPASQAVPPGTEIVAWESLRQNLPDLESSSWFSIFDTGSEDLRWRLAMIDTARVSLDLQYWSPTGCVAPSTSRMMKYWVFQPT